MKYFKIILIIILLALTAGCTVQNVEEVNVDKPVLKYTILKGKWTVTKCIFTDESYVDNFKFKDLIGKEVGFSKDYAIVLSQYVKNPKYKYRKLNAKEHLFRQYNIENSKVGITEETVDVIEVYNNDEFFMEVLKLSKNEALIYFRGFFIQINRIDEKITDDEIKKLIDESKDFEAENIYSDNTYDNGMLLGLRSESSGAIEEYRYKTLFIKLPIEGEPEIIEKNDIIVPIRSDFARVTVERKYEDTIYDEIKLEPFRETSTVVEKMVNNQNYLKKIDYVSADYISLVYTNLKTNVGFRRLKLLDNLDLPLSLRLGEIIPNGDKIFHDLAMSILQKSQMSSGDTSNIGIYRGEGYWKLKGRISDSKSLSFEDFEIKSILPKEIAKLNSLSIPYHAIKVELPNIRDAFTSFNGKYLITLEGDYLKIYSINYGKISFELLKEHPLLPETEVVMSEWSIGSYVGTWERVFKEE